MNRSRVVNGLHPSVWATLLDLLAIVVVDVTELALFLGAKVLADAEDRQIQEIAPLNGRRDLGDWPAVRQEVAVVSGQVAQGYVRDRLVPDVELQATLARRHAVRRGGVQPCGDDCPAQLVRSPGERHLFRRVPFFGLFEHALGYHVEREDEIRLRLMLAWMGLACACRAHECAGIKAQSRPQQVRFQHRLSRQAGVSRELRL